MRGLNCTTTMLCMTLRTRLRSSPDYVTREKGDLPYVTVLASHWLDTCATLELFIANVYNIADSSHSSGNRSSELLKEIKIAPQKIQELPY